MDSLPPRQSENRPLYGQYFTFSRPDPRFGATRQSLIAKKLQSEPIFCFQAPMTAFGKAMGETARAQCYRWSGLDAMPWAGRVECSALRTGLSGAVPRTRRRRKRSGHGFKEARYDGAFGKQRNRSSHGSTGGGAQCHENRSDRRTTKRAGYGAVGSDPDTTPQSGKWTV